MDIVIVKDGNLYIACSLSPVGVFGWGENEKRAKEEIEENLYDYCNWLCEPLPKEPESKIIKQYEGRLCKIAVEGDQKQNPKRIAEIKEKCRCAWRICIFFLSLQPITQLLTKLWTITRRKITIRKGGGWRARLLIPLPLKPFHKRKKD